MYETPAVGTILPAKENANPKIENPGPVHGSGGALNEWLQAQAQDTAWRNNKVLVEDWNNAKVNSPDYAAKLGAGNSWAVVVVASVSGGDGIDFDQQKVGPLVSTL